MGQKGLERLEDPQACCPSRSTDTGCCKRKWGMQAGVAGMWAGCECMWVCQHAHPCVMLKGAWV